MASWQGKRGTRHQRGYGAEWVKTRARILDRDRHLCQPCLAGHNTPTPATQVDHITPKAQGGSNDDDNLQAICDACHKAKTATEAAQAQGRRISPRIGLDGWPVTDEGEGCPKVENDGHRDRRGPPSSSAITGF